MAWRRPRIRRHADILLIAFLLISTSCTAATTTRRTWHEKPHAPESLVFGTNLALYDSGDQVVNNDATQLLLRQASVPIIRMPFRFTLSDAFELRALQAIKDIGAIPLVIIHGPTDKNALADDRHLISLTQQVFAAGTVYVEFGNEPDLAGINVQEYIAAWNAVIPTLQAMAPTYKFIGPVNFQPDPTYISTFDRYAHPRPAANSWHEYACQPYSPDRYCMTRIDDWATHVRQIGQAVRAAIGSNIPLMITEWNLDALPDSRYSNADFMSTWTAHAVAGLTASIPDGLVAAMQYCVTNNRELNLVDGASAPTLEGRIFFQALKRSAQLG